jgi:hypothetical protein
MGVLTTVAGLVPDLLGAWTADDERDHDRAMARLESRDTWTMRLCVAVIFGPWVWAWFDPAAGREAVAVMAEFPGWYQGLVHAAATAGLGLTSHRRHKRRQAQGQGNRTEPAGANPSGHYE